MSIYLKKANLALILILMISLLIPSSVNAAPKDSDLYRASFTKKSPTNQTTGLATTGVKLQWNAIDDIFQYRYCYYSYELTSNVCDIDDKSTWKSNGTSTSVTLPTLTTGKVYYWQVFAKLEDNSVVYADGSLSAKWSFTVGQTTVGAGIYDNTHSNWIYSGKWATLTGTGPYKSTYKESRDIPDYATFAFTGARVKLYYTQKPGRGVMNIYLDSSTTPIPLDQAGDGTLVYQKSWMSGTLASGKHTIKLVYISGGYVDIDAIEIFAQADTTAPAQINLSAETGLNAGTVTLRWTAVGDDATTGTATSYLVRYSTSEINDQTAWTNATVLTKNIPTPSAAGQAESMTVMGLIPGQTYHFSVRAQDDQFNTSELPTSRSAVAYDPPPAGEGMYDDTAPQWNYSHDWAASTSVTGPYSGSIHSATAANATASFTFQAPAAFVFYYTKDTNHGKFEIWVDGNLLTTINAYATTRSWQNTYIGPTYTDDQPHTVGIKNVDTSGKQADIDGIRITAPPASPAMDNPANPGIYDDTDSYWMYSTGWAANTATGPYSDTIHSTTTMDATASFVFQGPAFFTFYYAKNANRGAFEVWVDGNLVNIIDPYATTQSWQNTYISPAYADDQPHALVIRNISGGKQVDIDAIEITAPTTATDPDVYDDMDSHWMYSAGWTARTATGPYSGTFHYTTTINSAATFAFQAPANFTLYYAKNTNRGKFEIWVDGNLLTTINAYASTKSWQNKYTSSFYTDTGVHIVTIKNITSGKQMVIDAMEITAPPPAAGPDTYDDTDFHWIYSANWANRTATGPYNGTFHYTTAADASASITFQAPATFTFYYSKNTNRGKFEIWVDGKLLTTINAYAATKSWQNKYTSNAYTDDLTHTIEIKNITEGSGVDIDAIQITSP